MFLPEGANWLICTKQMYMKAHYVLTVILITVFAGCKSGNKENKEVVDTAESKHKPSLQQLIGSYVGAFGTNKITLLITRAVNDSVEGRTIVGGNDRPFSGTGERTNNTIAVVAKEPGDDVHDGTFNFTFAESTPEVIIGTWRPFRETEGGTKEYKLHRRNFKYAKGAGIYPEASSRLLEEDDVVNLTTEELELMRNEIFARHGYCFKKKNLRAAFEDKDWYIPNTTDVKGFLTPVEKQNITLIKKFEKYAESFGDSFGR